MDLKTKQIVSFRAINIEGLDDEDIREHEYLYQRTLMNAQGHIISEELFTPDSSLEHKSEFTYNPEGLLIEEILIEEDNFISEHRTIEYDTHGRISKEQLHYMDSSYDETIYNYDPEGRLLNKVTNGSDGETGNHVVCEYDGNRLIAETEYDPTGEVVTSKHLLFDDSGNMVEESIVSPDETYKASHEFDEAGNRKVTRRYNDKGQLIERYSYTRNEKGQLNNIKEETATGIVLTRMEYDDLGNMVLQESTTETEEPISRIDRTYDNNSQLLTTRVFIGGTRLRQPQSYSLRFEYELFE